MAQVPAHLAQSKTIFVGQLTNGVTVEDMTNDFAHCGEIAEVRIIKDRRTGESKGFGYVEFTSRAGVDKALAIEEPKVRGVAANVAVATEQWDADHEMPKSKKVWIGGVERSATAADIRALVEEVAAPVDVALPTKQGTDQHRGFAIVEYEDEATAEKVLVLNGTELNGRELKVAFAAPEGVRVRRPKREPREPREPRAPRKERAPKPKAPKAVSPAVPAPASPEIYVGNLPGSTDAGTLRTVFSDVVPVESVVSIGMSHSKTDPNVCGGFAYVTFCDADTAQRVLNSGKTFFYAAGNEEPCALRVEARRVKTPKTPRAAKPEAERRPRRPTAYVRNVPFECTEEELTAVFQQYGSIVNCDMPEGNRGFKGYAYIQYSCQEEADAAIAASGLVFKERPLTVSAPIPSRRRRRGPKPVAE